MASKGFRGIFDTIFGRKDMSEEETEEERKARLKRKKKREMETNKKSTQSDYELFDEESMLGKIKKRTAKRNKAISDL